MKIARPTLIANAALSTLIFWGCTSSPMGDDEISLGARQLSGSVVLDDRKSSEGVYVWLDGFNLGDYTDAEGKFQVTLPPVSSQGTPGGVTGVFKLYAYIANYNLASTQMRTLNGVFLFGQDNITDRGELNAPLRLENFLRVSTVVRPASASIVAGDTVKVQVTLQRPALYQGGAIIARLLKLCVHGNCPPETFGAILVRNVQSGETRLIQNPGATSRDLIQVETAPITHTMAFLPAEVNLSLGQYEAIPYLLLEHGEAVPMNLLQGIGTNVFEYGLDYLKIPFRREGGAFTVTADAGQ